MVWLLIRVRVCEVFKRLGRERILILNNLEASPVDLAPKISLKKTSLILTHINQSHGFCFGFRILNLMMMTNVSEFSKWHQEEEMWFLLEYEGKWNSQNHGFCSRFQFDRFSLIICIEKRLKSLVQLHVNSMIAK